MWWWTSKFKKTEHCSEFRKNKLKNPITKRAIKDKGPVQKWFVDVCSKKPTVPKPEKATARTLRPRYNNLSEFVKVQGPIGLEKLIANIMEFDSGKFIPDLKIAFTKAYRGALNNQLQEVILDLGARKFKISTTGPIAKKLRELKVSGVAESQIAGAEVSQRNFCRTKNMLAMPSRSPFQAQPHQLKAVGFMAQPNSRLLLYHGLGSGKSCSAAMVANAYLKSNPDNLVYFISPGGLRSNFITEYCTFCPVDRRISTDDKDYKNFRFFSLDDGTLKKKLPRRFIDCLVIVDEAQSLINCVKSGNFPPSSDDIDNADGVKNLTILYNKLTNDYRNLNLLLLSGTPAPDTIDQHYNMLRLLKPEEMKAYSFNSFKGLFTEDENTGYYVPVVDTLVTRLYSSCISFFKTSQADVARSSERIEQIDIEEDNPLYEVIANAMSSETMLRAIPIENLIRSLIKGGTPARNAMKTAVFMKSRAARRSKSCGLSNIVYPEQLVKDSDVEDSKVDDDRLLAYYKSNLKEMLERYAPKLLRLVDNLSDPNVCPGKQIIYCPFKVAHGVNLIGKILTMMGISNVVYSGDVSQTKREEVLRKYNDESNDQGEIVKVFLYTDAAAEGITLLSVRGVHLVNEDIYASHMRQVIGRAIRYKSHERLDPRDREVVIFRYRARVGIDSPDEMNYRQGMARERALRYLDESIKTRWTI
jgi:hypothetical protein